MKMKKIYITIILFISSIMIFAEEISKSEIIGKKNRFQICDTWVYIEFLDENKYTFCSPFGGYAYGKYDYSLVENKLTLEYCDEEIFYKGKNIQPLIFPEQKDVTYVWDSEYLDFYCIGAFIHGETIFTNGKNPTPSGTECTLNGVRVVKKDYRNSFLVAKENLRIRKSPSLNAETGLFNYSSYFNPYGLTFEDYIIVDNNINLPLLLKGLVVSFDAVTVEKQTIDGLTAHWYRIRMYDNSDEGTTEYFWVFGGYIDEITKTDNPKYKKQLIQSAIYKGILRQ